MSDPTASARIVSVVGAAGEIGTELCARLPGILGPGWRLRAADLRDDVAHGISPLDITDLDAYARHCAGVDTVIHLAGERDHEAGWDRLVGPNVIGAHHAFAAAQQAGCRRVVFASSVHAVAGHRLDERLGPATLPHPSGLYGATKLWGESLARVYADHGALSCICVRIGWAGAADDRRKLRVADARDLYLTYDDAARLFGACVLADDEVRFAVLNGASANTGSRFPVDAARRVVGYQPQDDAHVLWARLVDGPTAPEPPPRGRAVNPPRS